MSETPAWALTISFWLHMLATVTWVGGQAALSLLVLPASRKTLSAESHHKLLTDINKRMRTVGWLSLAVLIGTGLVQLSANENYQGFLAIDNSWAVAILVKHIAFGGILALSAYQTWGMAPTMERLSLLVSREKASPEEIEKLKKREGQILNLHLVLSVVVLFLTALARIS